MANYFCLIKFGKKEHLENLMNKGQMRFGSIQGFGQSTETERGDSFEGALNFVNGQFTKIECDHPNLGKHIFTPVANSTGRLIQFAADSYFCFSSYAMTDECFKENDSHTISEKMLAFGAYALVIHEPILFFEKIKTKLNAEGMESAFSLVAYRDFEEVGEFDTTLFSKTNTLSHQFEHRILVKTESKESAIFIEIGSIKDFCFLSTASDIINTEFKARRC